jgi:hypothetical protein
MASAKQVAYIADLDAKYRATNYAAPHFEPGTYGMHLMRQWSVYGTLCGRGASDLIGLYKRALQEAQERTEAEVAWYESLPPQPEARSYRDSWA